MTGDPREPNPDSPPIEDDRGSIEQIDEPHDPRESDPSVNDPALDDGSDAVGETEGGTRNQDDTV